MEKLNPTSLRKAKLSEGWKGGSLDFMASELPVGVDWKRHLSSQFSVCQRQRGKKLRRRHTSIKPLLFGTDILGLLIT